MINNFTNSDTQNLIYMIVMLSFLCFSLFFRRDLRLSKIIKYGFIWFGIIIFGVFLYSFRYEFSGIKDRIIGEINPSSARIRGDKIIINASKDGHFYLEAKVNGQDILFMIDTGASDIVLDESEAKKVGINLESLVFNKRYQTANGVVYGALTKIRLMEVAGVRFKNLSASVNSANLGTSLLGMSFLRRFERYEFYRDQLILSF